MTDPLESVVPRTWVAIDVAKEQHVVLIEETSGQRRQLRVPNRRPAVDFLLAQLRAAPPPVRIGLEPTGNYHRALAFRLVEAGFEVCLVSSVACARFREVRFNSWDKNDPKDAAVILALLKQGLTQRYLDPLHSGRHELQELSKTYSQLARLRTRIQHSLLTHHLPLYFPELQRYWHTSRGAWFVRLLERFPAASAIAALPRAAFVEAAWELVGRKVNKGRVLEEIYELAVTSLGLPVPGDGAALTAARLVMQHYLALTAHRAVLEAQAETLLAPSADYHALRSIPGIGPILALTILAEAGDLRRFGHHRQFLKYCGLDLAKVQSGAHRGREQLSKRGNRRLRSAFWMAGQVAVRLRENTFRAKYDRYIAADPTSADQRRKALTAVAAKMARVAYSVVKTQRPYRSYMPEPVPSGSIPLALAVEANRTS